MPNIRFQACIFDFDGVIIDSEPLHARAKQTTLDNFQVKYPPTLFADFKGRTDKAFFEFVVNDLASMGATAEEMDAYKRQVYLKLFENVPLVTGFKNFSLLQSGLSRNWEWQPQPPPEIFRWRRRSISFNPGLMSSSQVGIRRNTNLIPNLT